MKKVNALLVCLGICLLSVSPAMAVTLSGEQPGEATTQVTMQSDSGGFSISFATSSNFSVTDSDDTYGRLLFNVAENNESSGTTTEAVLAGVMKIARKNGKRVKKFFTVEQAREKGICGKKKVFGLWYLKTSSQIMITDAHYDDSGYIDQFEVTGIEGQTVKGLKKLIKKRSGKKKSLRTTLSSDCVVSGNGL